MPDPEMTTTIRCEWRPIRFSRFMRGNILSVDGKGLSQIFKHKTSGQIRIRSDMNFDGETVQVNEDVPRTMRARGFYGRLYISE